MSEWMPIETAPKDGTHLLLSTSDFGQVEGWWDPLMINFYKSQRGWASYDPRNAQGEWVSYHTPNGPDDRRMYCGMAPSHWQPLEAVPDVQEAG